MTNNNSDLIKTIALAHFAGVKPRLMQVLLNRYGSLKNIFSANAGSLMAIDGMTTDQANKISQAIDFLVNNSRKTHLTYFAYTNPSFSLFGA